MLLLFGDGSFPFNRTVSQADSSNGTYSVIRFRAVPKESQLILTLELAEKALQPTVLPGGETAPTVLSVPRLLWVGSGQLGLQSAPDRSQAI